MTPNKLRILHKQLSTITSIEDWKFRAGADDIEKDLLMVGPKVPKWFKPFSDGCSVPLPKKFRELYEGHTEIACYIHDFEYLKCRAIWRLRRIAIRDDYPKAEVYRLKILWNALRLQADAHFHSNIRMLYSSNGKNARGRVVASIYVAGVRAGGRGPAKWLGPLEGSGRKGWTPNSVELQFVGEKTFGVLSSDIPSEEKLDLDSHPFIFKPPEGEGFPTHPRTFIHEKIYALHRGVNTILIFKGSTYKSIHSESKSLWITVRQHGVKTQEEVLKKIEVEFDVRLFGTGPPPKGKWKQLGMCLNDGERFNVYELGDE